MRFSKLKLAEKVLLVIGQYGQCVNTVHQVVIYVCIKSPWSSKSQGQTSKQNTKSIFSAISSQQISGKNSESK